MQSLGQPLSGRLGLLTGQVALQSRRWLAGSAVDLRKVDLFKSMTLTGSSSSQKSQILKLVSTSLRSSFNGPVQEQDCSRAACSTFSAFSAPTFSQTASTPRIFPLQTNTNLLARSPNYHFPNTLAPSQHSQVSAFHASPFSTQEIQPEYSGAANATDKSVTGEPTGTLGPTSAKQKPRLVVLGTGWAGCRLAKDLDTRYWDIVVISPRNHMVS